MFKLIPETLFLCVFVIDKLLSLRNIARDRLQLIGVTSMVNNAYRFSNSTVNSFEVRRNLRT